MQATAATPLVVLFGFWGCAGRKCCSRPHPTVPWQRLVALHVSLYAPARVRLLPSVEQPIWSGAVATLGHLLPQAWDGAKSRPSDSRTPGFAQPLLSSGRDHQTRQRTHGSPSQFTNVLYRRYMRDVVRTGLFTSENGLRAMPDDLCGR